MTTVNLKRPVGLPKFKRSRGVRRPVSLFSYFVLYFMGFISLFPFYWMFVVASSGSDEISKIPPSIVPGPRFLEVMNDVYTAVPFNQALLNTVIVGVSISVAQVLFSSVAGFAFAKLQFRGRKWLILVIIGTMMLPSQLGIIPMFILMGNLGWIDTLYALIVPALITAFGVFWMRQIIDAQVPNELLEAASLDGASVWRTFRSIVFPVIRPSALVLGLFAFLGSWNDFLWPLLVLQTPENFTVQVAINQLKGSYTLDYALNMGGAFMATAPLLLLFVFVGKRLVGGVMDGAVKG